MKDKPLVSYCLFTYNQEAYVRESLEAALAQSYSPLEIVVSDDCSTDGTLAVIREVVASYIGEHRIILNVNEKNMGIGGHVSKVLLELSSGDFVVTVGGDDVSFPSHVEVANQRLQNAPEGVGVVDFSCVTIDKKSIECPTIKTIGDASSVAASQVYHLSDYLSMRTRIATFAPGRIISRKLLDLFGPISNDCPTEDTVLALRGMLAGGVLRTTDVVIKYRKHDTGVSSGGNLRKLSLKGIFDQYEADILTAYDLGLIDDVSSLRLLRRIRLDGIRRQSMNRFPVGSFRYYLDRLLVESLIRIYQIAPNLVKYEKRKI